LAGDAQDLPTFLAEVQVVVREVVVVEPLVLVVLQRQIKVLQVVQHIILAPQIQLQPEAAEVQVVLAEMVLSLAVFWVVQAVLEKVLT
jgi:hypothetical protein